MAEYFKVLLGLALIGLLGLSTPTCAQYIYEGNQSLVDLTNQSGTTNLNSGDDRVSNAFSLGFNFDFYNQTFIVSQKDLKRASSPIFMEHTWALSVLLCKL